MTEARPFIRFEPLSLLWIKFEMMIKDKDKFKVKVKGEVENKF